MSMNQLIERPNITGNLKIARMYEQFGQLLNQLEQRELSDEIKGSINQEILSLNSIADTDKHFAKSVKEKESTIIRLVEKELKIVPKNYYRKLWLVLGMTVFGLPLGVVMGSSIGNMGLLGMGLPIGLGIGIAVGSSLDKKAFNEGRQLDFEVKY